MERYQIASTASREFRSAAQETAHWRKLAQGAQKDLEGFMARKQFEVRDRLAISDEGKKRFQASGSSRALLGPLNQSQRSGGPGSQQLALMPNSRPQTVGGDPRSQAKELEETLQLIT